MEKYNVDRQEAGFVYLVKNGKTFFLKIKVTQYNAMSIVISIKHGCAIKLVPILLAIMQ
jgi:hypothetical protein